jgi:MFS family permease
MMLEARWTKEQRGILAACFAGMMSGVAAIPFYTLGVFAGPVMAETGWTMRQYQTAFTFVIVGTFFGPFFGHLCDKFGARPIALFSLVGFAIALASLAPAAKTGLYAYYAAWTVMAILGQGTGPVVWTHAVGHRFTQNRGLAFGIVMAGSGAFAMIGPVLVSNIITAWGMSAGYLMLALLVLCVPLPLVSILLKPVPANTIDDRIAQHAGERRGSTLGQALANFRFYVIGTSFFVVAFGVAGLISNMIPMLRSAGMSAQDSSRLIGLVGVAVIAGRLIMGALLDRFWAPLVATMALMCPAISCAILLNGLTGWHATIAILLVGFAAGAEFDIVAFLVSKYFGMKAYGKIYGLLYIALFVGAAIAPAIFGWVYDAQGSYRSILQGVAVATPLAALALLALGRYPDFRSAVRTVA